VVVSGGAKGIDAASHLAALRVRGRTWVVAGTGPRHCYPLEHQGLFEQVGSGPGAMLWPCEAGPRGDFLGRNEVLVALADAVVIVQAGARSGALHAAGCALRQGKPLWVMPAAPWMKKYHAGSLRLLGQGARPLIKAQTLLDTLGRRRSHEAPSGRQAIVSFSPTESKILQVVSQAPVHRDILIERAGLNTAEVTAALLTLALENVVVEGPPGFFRRNVAP
jgi:DNA processing protein